MYFSRTGNIFDLIVWLVLAGMFWLGGLLLVTCAFRLHKRERLISGLAVGFLLFIVLNNLWSNFVPYSYAVWGSSVSVFGLGLIAWGKSQKKTSLLNLDSFSWPQLIAMIGLIILFTLMNRGLAILDDYHNLPLVSMIAAGDVPPHFYLNPENRLAYHYGLHLFSGSLVQQGGLFPWSAFDFGKALSQAVLILLAWLWFKRVTRSDLASYLGAGLVLFGGGARWLMLFLPESWLMKMNDGIQLLGSARHSGPDLYTVMISSWEIEGGGPFPFPFAFVNGVFSPAVLAIAGSGAVPALTIILMLLLRKKRWQPINGLVFGLIISSLALTAEHLFLLVVIGISVVLLAGVIYSRSLANIWEWGWVFVPAILLALGAGGVLTEVTIGLNSRFSGGASQSYGFTGFGFRWPPALMSAHFGRLEITQPGQLLVAFFEIGVVLLVSPGVTMWAWKRFKRGTRFIPGLGFAAIIGFLLPLVLTYAEHERDITRLTASALFIWLVLGWPLVWLIFQKGSRLMRIVITSGYAITVISGVVLFAISLLSIPKPQFSYFVDVPDAIISERYWDNLEEGAQVFDPIAFRAVTLFGRAAGPANLSIYIQTPKWETLIKDPDPTEIARAGYSYMYFDKTWWRDLQPKQRNKIDQPCVVEIMKLSMPDKDFRWLLDIRECR